MLCVLNSIKGLYVLVNNIDIYVYGFYFFIKIWIFKMKCFIDFIDNFDEINFDMLFNMCWD